MYNGTAITHDEIGNPLNDGTWTYTWSGRQLTSMTDGTTTWNYKYNADGLRTEKTDGTTTYKYVYSGSTLVQMQINSNVLSFGYDGSTPVTVTYNDTTYYYVTNLQGDIVSILDGNRTEVVKYTYDAWGNILSTTGTLANTLGEANPLRYRGYVYDSETGLYYLQSRYYDPEMGRFINADAFTSTGQGILGNNMFAYCLNRPVSSLDSTGQLSDFAGILNPNIMLMSDPHIGSIAGPYKTAEEAAKAFSEYIYSSSIYIRHEYSTVIYSTTENGVTNYYLNYLRSGNPHSALVDTQIPESATLVAYAHTHPNSNYFSQADINVANKLNCDAYVVGPNLILQKYDLASGSFLSLSSISLRPLSESEKATLVKIFEASWLEHLTAGCAFDSCYTQKWPTN